MANGLAEKRGRGHDGIKNRNLSNTAGIRLHKLNLSDRFLYEDFKGTQPIVVADVGAGAGTTTTTNLIHTGSNLFECNVVGTQTVFYPTLGTGGYDFKGDDGATGSEGFELTAGITAQSRMAFTAGTDAFYMKFKFSVADQSGMASMYCGFRLAEAYQAAIASYDTYGAIGLNRVNASAVAKIVIADELDADAGAVVDTTNTYTETDDLTLGVYVAKDGTFSYTINGAAPTVTATLKATAGDVLIPFICTLDHTDTPGATIFKELEIGLIDANVR